MEKISVEKLMLSKEVKLIKCPIEHLDELVAVSREAYIDNYRHIWTDSGANYLEKNFTTAVLGKDFSDANIVYFFVNKNDENIGFVKLHLDSAVENYASVDSIYLERLYLKKVYCGRGIGAEVMHKLFEFSEKHAKKVMWLRAMPSTPTVKFYERLGFRTVAEGKIPFPFIKTEHSPLFTMVKNLQN